MKKSLLALAVLGAFAGVASAQSSVTLYGTVDLNARYVKADGQDRRLTLSQDGINSSQLGFRGVEDLGGGLKAGFNLLAGVNADTGTTNSKFFNRRSTVSLFSNVGELRLGRDYTPTFWNQTIFDAFGTNGLGSSLNVRQSYGGTRQDNSIGYFLPSNLGGFYGQLMMAAGEGGGSGDRLGKYVGGQFGFRAGPFDVAFAYSEMKPDVSIAASAATGAPLIVAFTKIKTANVGGSFDFGFMKIMGYYDEDKVDNGKEKTASISASFPFGQSEVRVGYDVSKMDNSVGPDSKLDNIKATYQYNLSKRTAMYGTVARLNNKDATTVSLPGVFSGNNPTAGGDSKGFEVGIRHFF